jgi:ketosteroid isomerase-like protein
MNRSTATDAKPRQALSSDLSSEVRGWLTAMEECVRERNFERARTLFSPDVFAFGSLTPAAEGLDNLERDQWREVWNHTSGFRFELDLARSMALGQGACVAAPWRSLGVRTDGSTFERRGRATLVLQRVAGRLVAVHSHFSLQSQDPKPGRP